MRSLCVSLCPLWFNAFPSRSLSLFQRIGMEPLSHMLHAAGSDEAHSDEGESRGDLLRLALARGIITRKQYEAILALDPAAAAAPRAEMKRGFNWTTVAYGLGAMIVVFAFGWFLVDQWDSLGPGGVLVVSLVYAALFAGAGVLLRREEFSDAGGYATTLAVLMTPLVAWSVLRLGGLWPEHADLPRQGFVGDYRGHAWDVGRWVVLQLATVAAALATLRRIRFAFLAAPIAAALPMLPLEVASLLSTGEPARHAEVWLILLGACAVGALAYAVDRREGRAEDYASWFYTSAMIAAAVGLVNAWDTYREIRHAFPLVAIGLIAASFYLRRRLVAAFGTVVLFAYLAYVAFDLFEDSPAFPAVLATLGILLILATVWVQKSYPVLARRFGSDPSAPPRLPGHYALPALAAAFCLVMLVPAVRSDREARSRADRDHVRYARAQARSEAELRGKERGRD